MRVTMLLAFCCGLILLIGGAVLAIRSIVSINDAAFGGAELPSPKDLAVLMVQRQYLVELGLASAAFGLVLLAFAGALRVMAATNRKSSGSGRR